MGPVVASHIRSFFEVERNREVIADLIALGVGWSLSKPYSAPNCADLSGQTWVLTGTLTTMTRDEASDKLRSLGAKVAGSVSAKTTVLVAGPGAGGKLDKAEAMGVEIIDEVGLMELLGCR